MRFIDADALKVELGISDECDDCERHGNFGCINCTWATVCDRIDNAPTIDDPFKDKSIEQLMDECFNHGYRKAVKHGQWESVGDDEPWLKMCSKCKTLVDNPGTGWNYCPNCGARMDEEVNHED